jgi:hypothetical protein
MKRIFSTVAIAASLIVTTSCKAQEQEDKSKRPSPPAVAKATLKNGAGISVDYSQPSVKGRTIGKEIAPYGGKIWRTGANEPTTITLTKDVMVEGKQVKAGTYAIYSYPEADEWTILFNKNSNGKGAFEYDAKEDVLNVKVKPMKSKAFTERMTFNVEDGEKLVLLWGDIAVPITIK